MTYLTITEFDHLARDISHRDVGAPQLPAVAEQSIELGLVPEESGPFKGRFICIHVPVPVALAFGKEPKADAKYHNRAPGDHWYGVNPGDKLSVMMVS